MSAEMYSNNMLEARIGMYESYMGGFERHHADYYHRLSEKARTVVPLRCSKCGKTTNAFSRSQHKKEAPTCTVCTSSSSSNNA